MISYISTILLLTATVSQQRAVGYYDPTVFYNTSRYEGDIIGHPLGDDFQLEHYHATSDKSILWPKGVMVYHIDASLFPQTFLIKNSMNHITTMTGGCITFKERTFEPAYVHMYQNQGCYSAVGRQGNAQELSLGQGCHVSGVVIHELLHALGFYHYHSRSDRDKYLRIFLQNIVPSMVSQFDKLTPYQNHIYTDFDYNSIMIYGQTAFSKDGRSPTMLPIKAGIILSDPGYKAGLTDKDVISIKKLYGCK